MALTTQEIEDYKEFLEHNATLFASDNNSIVDVMSESSFKRGLECGNLSLSNLNFLLLGAFLSSSDALNDVKSFLKIDTVVDLRNFTSLSEKKFAIIGGYRTIGDEGGGLFYAKTSDTSTVDDSVVCFVDADGTRWLRFEDQILTTKQAGCYADGVVDDVDNLNNWFSAVRLYNATGYISNGVYKCLSPILWQLGGNINGGTDRANGLTITGSGQGSSILDFTSIQAGTVFKIDTGGESCFYWNFENFTVLGNTTDTLFKIGDLDYTDEFNRCKFKNIEAKNVNTLSMTACALEATGLYNCEVDIVCNGGASGQTTVPQGTSLIIRRWAFCESQLVAGNNKVAVDIQGSYTYGNKFKTIDIEEVSTGLLMSGDSLTKNSFDNGTIVANVCIKSTATNSHTNVIQDAVNTAPYSGGIQFDPSFEGFEVRSNINLLTTPVFPSSGTAITNNQPQTATVYIFGGLITLVEFDGGAGGTMNVNTDQAFTIRLPVGKTIKLTYSGSPGWLWVGGL